MEDYYSFENEFNFDNMYFSKKNNIKLSEIYSEVKLLKNCEEKKEFKMLDENKFSIQLRKFLEQIFFF